jgi:hypothetical protein
MAMAMGRYGLSCLLAVALGCGLVACGDDDDGTAVDAGPDGSISGSGASGRGGSGGKGGSSGTAGVSGTGTPAGTGGSAGSAGTMAMPPLECGNDTCPALEPGSAMLGVTQCCTDSDECGVKTPLAASCLPMDSPGGVDPSCPIFEVMGGMLTWYGCCTPAGTCGAQAGGNLGCIPNAELMAAEQSCTYDPANTCERLVDVACDGAEDCPGQKCCAVYQGGYRKFECADDCAVADAPPSVYSSEACHPGESCTVAVYSCFQNTMILPDYLFRCRDTGEAPVNTGGSVLANEINCGDAVCGANQKCCISVPGQAVCTPKDQPCKCVPEGVDVDAGVEDAGQQ